MRRGQQVRVLGTGQSYLGNSNSKLVTPEGSLTAPRALRWGEWVGAGLLQPWDWEGPPGEHHGSEREG